MVAAEWTVDGLPRTCNLKWLVLRPLQLCRAALTFAHQRFVGVKEFQKEINYNYVQHNFPIFSPPPSLSGTVQKVNKLHPFIRMPAAQALYLTRCNSS